MQEWIMQQAGGKKRAIGGYVRSIFRLIMDGTWVLESEGQIIGVRGRELTARQLKERKGKGQKKGLIQTLDAPADLFAELNAEIKARFAKKKDNATIEIMHDMKRSSRAIREELLLSVSEAPDPPPRKKERGGDKDC
jgi:hypothetical protein